MLFGSTHGTTLGRLSYNGVGKAAFLCRSDDGKTESYTAAMVWHIPRRDDWCDVPRRILRAGTETIADDVGAESRTADEVRCCT